MQNCYGQDPNQWEEETLIECLSDVYPSKTTAPIEFFKNSGSALMSFFKFLEFKNLIKTKSLQKALTIIKEDMIKIASDESNWGMAKKMAMSALNQGIDLRNKNEMQKFINKHNSKI